MATTTKLGSLQPPETQVTIPKYLLSDQKSCPITTLYVHCTAEQHSACFYKEYDVSYESIYNYWSTNSSL